MKRDGLYETKISDARWWRYDIPGNAGWILYFVCVVRLLRQGTETFAVVAVLPAILMLIESVLCAVFAGLLYKGYRRVED